MSSYPTPRDSEHKAAYLVRLDRDPAVRSNYPTPTKRRVLAERMWSKAKGQSLVSIATSKGEVLLF
jgi:hypothetical protein